VIPRLAIGPPFEPECLSSRDGDASIRRGTTNSRRRISALGEGSPVTCTLRKTIRKTTIHLGLTMFAIAMLGCSSTGGPIRAASPSTAMIFGHLDLPEAVRDKIQWIHIYNYGEVYVPPFKTPVVARFFPNGDFFAEGVKPGKYYIHHVVAGFEAFYLYPPKISAAKEAILERLVEVEAGEVVYLGNHRLHDWKRGLSSKMSPTIGNVRLMSSTPGAGPEPIPNFMNHSSWMTAGSGTFSMELRSVQKEEERALRHVLQEVPGSGWDAKIEAKLMAKR
jgi:hypothetical protein